MWTFSHMPQWLPKLLKVSKKAHLNPGDYFELNAWQLSQGSQYTLIHFVLSVTFYEIDFSVLQTRPLTTDDAVFSPFRFLVHKEGILLWERQVCLWYRRTTWGSHRVTGAGHESFWFPHLKRANPACARNSWYTRGYYQSLCPFFFFFFHLGQEMDAPCFATAQENQPAPKSKRSTYETWRVGLLFFLKVWMRWYLRADSWEAGQSGSWVLYYTSKIWPAPRNFVSLTPSCSVGHCHT